MSTFTFATLLSGGGLGAVGLRAAGGVPLWAVDIRPDIAAWYERNLGSPCRVADVTALDFTNLAVPDVALLTPSCKNASSAKVGAGEAEEDRAVARALVRYIVAQQPPVVLLENVWGYRLFESFQVIVTTLHTHGYSVDYQHLNAADFGVPQTRKRLILRAVRGAASVPVLTPTHSRTPDWFHASWQGWYAAIEDLLPTLPESAFAPWQLARLPDLVASTLVLPSNIDVESRFHRDADEPAATVTAASLTKLPIRAYLVPGRVVQMTPRALARFQTLPDSYALPDKAALACEIIGNGLPCLLAKAVVESVVTL